MVIPVFQTEQGGFQHVRRFKNRRLLQKMSLRTGFLLFNRSVVQQQEPLAHGSAVNPIIIYGEDDGNIKRVEPCGFNSFSSLERKTRLKLATLSLEG